jgi:hypothetical protein
LKPAASDNKAQAQVAVFQKTAQALGGFVSLPLRAAKLLGLRVLFNSPSRLADEVIDESRDVCFWPISLKKSVSNFEIIGPAIRRCSIANR